MSLTYFSDPANVQLAESPYEWDAMMAGWDDTYGKFDDKIPKLVWRGRITGYTYRDGERPRQNLIRYSRDYLDIMDVKPSTKKSLMKQDDFQMYKAILDIDGNAWSARLGKLLCYNSVVIKVEPEYVGYWEVSSGIRGDLGDEIRRRRFIYIRQCQCVRFLATLTHKSSLPPPPPPPPPPPFERHMHLQKEIKPWVVGGSNRSIIVTTNCQCFRCSF